MTLGVIIPTLNRPKQLAITIASLLRISEISEILIVDDGSEVPVSISHEKIRVLRQPVQLGESAAINRAWREISASFVAVVSDDDPQGENWISPILKSIRNSSQNTIAWYPSTLIWKNNLPAARINALPYSRRRFWGLLKCPCLAGVVINRVRLLDCGVTEIRPNGVVFPNDLIQWLELSKFGPFQAVTESEAYWHTHNDQLSNTLNYNYKAEQFLTNVGLFLKKNSRYATWQSLNSLLFRSFQFLTMNPRKLLARTIRLLRLMFRLRLVSMSKSLLLLLKIPPNLLNLLFSKIKYD